MSHERCECHECTQARYRVSLQGQIDAAFGVRPIRGGTIWKCEACGELYEKHADSCPRCCKRGLLAKLVVLVPDPKREHIRRDLEEFVRTLNRDDATTEEMERAIREKFLALEPMETNTFRDVLFDDLFVDTELQRQRRTSGELDDLFRWFREFEG